MTDRRLRDPGHIRRVLRDLDKQEPEAIAAVETAAHDLGEAEADAALLGRPCPDGAALAEAKAHLASLRRVREVLAGRMNQ